MTHEHTIVVDSNFREWETWQFVYPTYFVEYAEADQRRLERSRPAMLLEKRKVHGQVRIEKWSSLE